MRITAPFLLALSLSLLALPPHACGQMGMGMEGYGGDQMYGGGGMGDMGMGMMGNMPKQPQVRYVILLGPDFDSSKSPFTDAYELVATTNNFIRLEQVRIDLSTPLPTKPGISVHARYPKEMDENELAEWKQQVKLDALRFGIADVQYSPIDSLNGDGDSGTAVTSTFVSVRIGVQSGGMSGGMPPVGINKYASAALSLDPKQPQVELFDQSRLRSETDAQDDSGGYGMDGGGYGGVAEYSRVMKGMGDYGGMGGGMGDSYGMEYPTPKRTPAASEGTIHGNGLILSWSLEQGYASAIGTSAGGRWMQVKLNGERMTMPVVGSGACAFYCDNDAYAFSAQLGRWDVLKLDAEIDPLPAIVVDGQSVNIKTADDYHVFSATAGRWSSRSQASQLPQPTSGDDPFGDTGGRDPFATPSVSGKAVDPFGGDVDDPFGVGSADADPFGVSSSQQWADPVGSEPLSKVLSEQQMQARIESNHQSAIKLQGEIQAAAKRYTESADEAEQQQLELQLLELVHRAFDLRSEKQYLELALLESKMKTLSQQMQLRQTKRDEIARKQVKQLTGSK